MSGKFKLNCFYLDCGDDINLLDCIDAI